MPPDATGCEHANRRLNDLSASTETEKSGPMSGSAEKQKRAKYGACEARDDQLAKKAAKDRELARFDQQQHKQMPHKKHHSEDGGHSPGFTASSSSGEPLKQQQLTFIERLAKIIPGLGIILALLSSLFLGTAGMLVKLTTSVHGIQVAVLRNLIQLILYSVIIGFRGIGIMPARTEALPVASRAILGGTSITLSYCALKLIPLGDATTIRFSLPIWTLIMGYFFLRESCSLFKISAVVICIAGVMLIARPDECLYLLHMIAYGLKLESAAEFQLHKQVYEQVRVQEIAYLLPSEADSFSVEHAASALPNNSTLELNSTSGSQEAAIFKLNQGSVVELLQGEQNPFDEADKLKVSTVYGYDPLQQLEGCMMALAASICLSISVISLRMCQKTPAEIIIFWLSSSSVLGGTAMLLAINKWSLPDNLRDVLYVLLNGLCGAIGQWFMTCSLKVEQSGIISLARTFDIEIAFLYSALLLGEEIRPTSIVGSLCVMAGVVIVVIPRLLASSAGSSAGSDERDTSSQPPAAPGGRQAAGAIIDRSSYQAQRNLAPAFGRQTSDDSAEHQTTTTIISRAA